MKKLLLIPAALLLSLFASAQASMQIVEVGSQQTLTANQVINMAVFASTNIKTTLDIRNTSNSPKTYNVRRYDMTLNTVSGNAAEAYFCFGGSCYGAATYTSPTSLVLQPGKAASDTNAAFYLLVADLDEAPVAGLSVVKYTFFNVYSANDTMQITLRYNGLVGINKVNKDLNAFDVYPNPASESAFLKVNALKAFDSKLTVYNSLGAVVSEKQLTISEGKNNIDLKVESYPTGIYFINIKTSESSVTKRLIIK
ncbi:MAG: T9SS type A sorting domain-containing protein [Bacteroidota bacterium]